MQRFFVKKSISAAICITMAFSVCAYSAAASISEASISIAAEMSSRVVENLESAACETFSSAQSAVNGFFKTALSDIMLLKAEVTQAIIPEP